MIGWELYRQIINNCYELDDCELLPVERSEGSSLLVLDAVNEHFRTIATTGPEFDHLSPAIYLLEHAHKFVGSLGFDEALARFELFFEAVNPLLPPRLG